MGPEGWRPSPHLLQTCSRPGGCRAAWWGPRGTSSALPLGAQSGVTQRTALGLRPPPPPTGLGAQAHPQGQCGSRSPKAPGARTAAGHLALAASPAPRPSTAASAFSPEAGRQAALRPDISQHCCPRRRPDRRPLSWLRGEKTGGRGRPPLAGRRGEGRAQRGGSLAAVAGDKGLSLQPRSPHPVSHTHLPHAHGAGTHRRDAPSWTSGRGSGPPRSAPGARRRASRRTLTPGPEYVGSRSLSRPWGSGLRRRSNGGRSGRTVSGDASSPARGPPAVLAGGQEGGTLAGSTPTCSPGSQQGQKHKAFVRHFIFKRRAGTPVIPRRPVVPWPARGHSGGPPPPPPHPRSSLCPQLSGLTSRRP